MSFSILPNEVLQEILTQAVLVRNTPSGIHRALRLRLVSRLWSVTTLHAIYQSGILKDPELPACPYICRPFWAQYLVDSSTRLDKPLTRPLLVIRKVAKHVLTFRGEDTSEENIKDFIGEISRALLATAAFTNEVQLVNELLPRFKESTHLIAPNAESAQTPVLGYPFEAAVFNGHYEVASGLLDVISDESSYDDQHVWVLQVIVHQGQKRNNLEIFKLALDLEPDDPHTASTVLEPRFMDDFALARSVEAFERLFELYVQYVADECYLTEDECDYDDSLFLDDYDDGSLRSMRNNSLTKFNVLLSLLYQYVSAGEVPPIEHVIQMCTNVDIPIEDLNNTKKYKLMSPLGRAAQHGHLDTAVYLFEKGFIVDSNSIQKASLYGNLRMMRLLLEHSDHNMINWENALLQAV
ncbi:hypothetical protein F4811DRAFT_555071 [Daldinia bambusicola]|nr:hypothetical protein F4811DRAFT_555071 [Daldinia bambusicola]